MTLQGPQSPGEIKEEGGELDSHEEVRHFCGSRRDQEEGGGAGRGAGPRKLDFFCFSCYSTAVLRSVLVFLF